MNKAIAAVGLGIALGCLASVPAVVPQLRPELVENIIRKFQPRKSADGPVKTATLDGKWVLLAPPREGETGIGWNRPLSKWVVVRSEMAQRQWCENFKAHFEDASASGFNWSEPKTVAEVSALQKWKESWKCMEQSELDAAVKAEPKEVWRLVAPYFHVDKRLHKIVVDDDKPLDQWDIMDKKTTFSSQEMCDAYWTRWKPSAESRMLRGEDNPETIQTMIEILDDVRCSQQVSK